MLAQEVTVNMPPDQVGRIVSVAAVVIALASLAYSALQGQALRRIGTTQHEWEKIDRKSAAIEVTSYQPLPKYSNRGQAVTSYSPRLRLTNTGRVVASDVSWSDEHNVVEASRDSIEQLHPGEHYELILALNQSVAPGWKFTVKWTDDRGPHLTTRRMSL